MVVLAKVPPLVVSRVPPLIASGPVKLLAPCRLRSPAPVLVSPPPPVKLPVKTESPDWLIIRVFATLPVVPPRLTVPSPAKAAVVRVRVAAVSTTGVPASAPTTFSVPKSITLPLVVRLATRLVAPEFIRLAID